MNQQFGQSSRRDFLKASASATINLAVFGRHCAAMTQKAAFTAAQMRASGATAKTTVIPLRDGVSLLAGSGGNMLVTSGPDGKLIVDSGYATSQAQVQTALSTVSSAPLRYLVNTHWHFDHTDGNEWMHKAGAEIIAQTNTRKRMSSRQVIPAFEAVLPPSPITALPTSVFEQTESLQINGRSIRLRRYTPAHTDSDISVFFPDANILHTGDTWFNRYYPFIDYDSGGSIRGLLAAASNNLSLTDQQTIVVPGHGEAGSRRHLIAFQEMLQSIYAKVANQKKAGRSLRAVIASKPTSAFDGKWEGGFITPQLLISLVYQGS